MDKKTEKYYEDLFDLFSRKGWKILIKIMEKDVRKMEQDVIMGELPETALNHFRGQITVIRRLSTMEDIVKDMYDQLKEQEADEGQTPSGDV